MNHHYVAPEAIFIYQPNVHSHVKKLQGLVTIFMQMPSFTLIFRTTKVALNIKI